MVTYKELLFVLIAGSELFNGDLDGRNDTTCSLYRSRGARGFLTLRSISLSQEAEVAISRRN